MIRRLLILGIIGTVAALLLRAYVIEGIYVASASMETTLVIDSKLFLEKVTFAFREPRRGEIVVLPSPVEVGRDLIKRVIGLPGEVIEIHDKIVYIGGTQLDEPYVRHSRPYERLVGDNIEPMEIPAGMLFVMGDNRDESKDSRDWKDPATGEKIYFVPVGSIKGKVVGVY